MSDRAAVALDRDVLRVAGPEAAAYLQGQLSQDVLALAAGASAWSLILQPQGKVDAWVRVSRVADDEFVIDVDAGWGEATIARLTRFKLRTKADIDPLPWRCVAVRGPSAQPFAVPPGSVLAGAEWALIGGFDALGPEPAAPAGVAIADLDAYDVRRIEAGLPRMGAELTDATIPAEAGVVPSSVSFTKGCYTGQELVARIDSRGGNVPRRIVGARLASVVDRGTTVTVTGRDVGTVTSVAAHPHGGAVALVLLRRDVEVPADAVTDGVATALGPLPLVS